MNHRQLRLICKNPKVDVTVNMGDGPSTPTAGFSGWEVVDRVRRKGMTSRTGVEPFQQDVPIFLDGFSENRSVERPLEQILSLGEESAIFHAYGPIDRDGELFIFGADPEFSERRKANDGTTVRARLTLKLMEYVPGNVAGRSRRGKEAIGEAVALTYTTVAGDTLTKIAHALYHDWTRWREIGRKNGITDPHRLLPPGRELKL
ncbi:MAG TPA: LysM domain-containing protein [Solirubrobacterales bacterium]|nr:LysM domain-containing protein [Solirubrobacterales bacterium]